MGKASTVETYIIPHNNPPLMFDQTDFLRLHRIELQQIRGDGAMSPVPFQKKKTMNDPGPRAASRLYRLRFLMQSDEKRAVESTGRFQHIENTLPPNVGVNHLQVSPDPRTLPPGMAEVPMATVIQVIGGEIVGGVTFAILEKNQRQSTKGGIKTSPV
jgi:hypothetical protein